MGRTTVFAVVASLPLAAFAGEQRIKKSDVPPAVLAAVSARNPQEMTGFTKEIEDGKTLYEVQIKTEAGRAELIVTPDGKIVAEEHAITVKQLPDAVRQGLAASAYAKAKVQRVEKVIEFEGGPQTRFELLVVASGKMHELVFDEAGALTKDEEKKQGEED